MSSVLIAYNNDCNTELHHFFESCSDEAKQACLDNKITFESVCPPNLNADKVCGKMESNSLCVIVSHGINGEIINENNEEVISIHTTNYNFANKGLYALACYSGLDLKDELIRIGIKFFVGYSDSWMIGTDKELFLKCALQGLKDFLSGKSKKDAKECMISTYKNTIKDMPSNSFEDNFQKMLMINNLESLVFEGEDDLLFSDLA